MPKKSPPSKFESIISALYREGKINTSEASALTAAMDCFSYEMEHEGIRSEPHLVKKYGTLIRGGLKSLNAPKD